MTLEQACREGDQPACERMALETLDILEKTVTWMGQQQAKRNPRT
jgi:hypothetical protein